MRINAQVALRQPYKTNDAMMPFRLDTPFRKKARQLKAPNNAAFNLHAWIAEAASSASTEEDARLIVTGLWLANEAKKHREYFVANPLPKLSVRLSVTLAVAALNSQSALMAERLEKAQLVARKAGGMAADFLTHVAVKNGASPLQINSSSFTDASVDATNSWLFDVVDTQEPNPQQAELGRAAGRLLLYYSTKRSHYDIWQQVLWENFELHSGKKGSNTNILLPADPDLTALLNACNHRNKSNAMGYAWVDVSAWPLMSSPARRKANLARTVVAMERKANKARSFTIARPTTNTSGPPDYMLGRAQLDISYLAGFLNLPFPNNSELCLDLLVRAWYVLRDLAAVLAGKRPPATFADIANVRAWALVTKKAELVDILARALDVPAARAQRIVEFFSWRKRNYKGLWGAPFVPLPGSDEFALAQCVLDSANMMRTAEVWLANGGLDDNAAKARGDIFERALRAKMCSSLSKNKIVTDTACAEHEIKKGKGFPEQIDLVIRLGLLLLVAEVKCFSFPADSRERYNHLRKLRDAAKQARDKAAAIAAQPDVAAKALGLSKETVKALTVVPIVVINQGYGMSLEFDGCVVTDTRFLDLYLGSGKYISEAAVDRTFGGSARNERDLYRTAQEAVDNFAATMRKPPPLQRFVDRLRWTSLTVPTMEDGHALLVAHTKLQDVSGELRKTYEALSAMVGEDAYHQCCVTPDQ